MQDKSFGVSMNSVLDNRLHAFGMELPYNSVRDVSYSFFDAIQLYIILISPFRVKIDCFR